MKIPTITSNGVIIEHKEGQTMFVVNGKEVGLYGFKDDISSRVLSFGAGEGVWSLSLEEFYEFKKIISHLRPMLLLYVNRPNKRNQHNSSFLTKENYDKLLTWNALSENDRYDITIYRTAIFEESRSEYPFSSTTCVYLMSDSATGFTKIGRSVKPEFREKTLMAQAPTVSLVCYWSECENNHESELHNLFKDKRKRGEWFHLSTDDLKLIEDFFSEREKEKVNCLI